MPCVQSARRRRQGCRLGPLMSAPHSPRPTPISPAAIPSFQVARAEPCATQHCTHLATSAPQHAHTSHCPLPSSHCSGSVMLLRSFSHALQAGNCVLRDHWHAMPPVIMPCIYIDLENLISLIGSLDAAYTNSAAGSLHRTRAVCSGSSSSGGGGVRAVFTAQKRHPRVHVSPGPTSTRRRSQMMNLQDHRLLMGRMCMFPTGKHSVTVTSDTAAPCGRKPCALPQPSMIRVGPRTRRRLTAPHTR